MANYCINNAIQNGVSSSEKKIKTLENTVENFEKLLYKEKSYTTKFEEMTRADKSTACTIQFTKTHFISQVKIKRIKIPFLKSEIGNFNNGYLAVQTFKKNGSTKELLETIYSEEKGVVQEIDSGTDEMVFQFNNDEIGDYDLIRLSIVSDKTGDFDTDNSRNCLSFRCRPLALATGDYITSDSDDCGIINSSSWWDFFVWINVDYQILVIKDLENQIQELKAKLG